MSELHIRAVDPANEAEMDRYQEVYVEAETAELPTARIHPQSVTVQMLSQPSEALEAAGYAAFLGTEMVGSAFLIYPMRDNTFRASLHLHVPPSYAGRGIGSALLEYAEKQALARQRNLLWAEAHLGADRNSRSRRFAERHGFTLANTQVERCLELPVDVALLDQLDVRPMGYRVETFVGPIPSDLSQSFCDLLNQMWREMPVGELEGEEERRTPQDLVEQNDSLVAHGRDRISVLALTPDDEVAALTVVVTDPEAEQLDQLGTLVARPHRGHRLGMATKVAQLRHLAAEFPDYRLIRTTNAETNQHMIAINDALGFRVHSVEGEFQKRI